MHPVTLTASEAAPQQQHLCFIDVREAHEFAAGHIPGATLLPLSEIRNGSTGTLQSGTPYVVYCQAGVRSQMAIALLQQKGFQHLTNLSDGYSGWVALGK